MLVTRHAVTEQSPWSISKFETAFRKSGEKLRMSNNFDTTQSDWQAQYSFLPPGDNPIFSQSYEHVTNSGQSADPQAQPRTVTVPAEVPKPENSPLGHRVDPLGLRQPKQPSPVPEQQEVQGNQYPPKTSELTTNEESSNSTETPAMSLGSNPLSSVSSGGHSSETAPNHSGNEGQNAVKEEDEEVVEDEEMAEGEHQEGESQQQQQQQQQQQAQTAAERTAQRRKMKRFRLTHQQTRFLMSEFAKQPHPDAAHRERLSREIPGLSPRQVQVWFQNRRAKIKRLNADDRERMLKMRAVPEDFDSLGALHSQYGAPMHHGLGTPLTSPVDLGGASYADHMMRPLMVDVRRHEGDEHLSPTGLSPAFGSIGFNPSAGLSTPDILSPISPTSTDRYGYPSHLSAAPLTAGPRGSNPFARQASLDSGMQMHSHQRQQIRPLQPLQLRDPMARPRSDSLQSPLRTSMSWKGDAIDYTTYHGGNSSPQIGPGQRHDMYQQSQVGGSSAGGLGPYDSTSYAAASTVQSPTHYSSFQPSGLQANQQRTSRLRAASASLPLGLDLRTQFRSAIGSGGLQTASTHSPGGPRTPTTPHLAGGVSSSYTGSFPSAPLTAPVDFSLPRTSPYHHRTSTTDYSMPQMSAPIAPPNDFSQAFQAATASMSSAATATRTPIRDSFGGAGGPLGLGPAAPPPPPPHGHGQSTQAPPDHHRPPHPADDYTDPLGMKRKRSFTGPAASVPPLGAAAYGSTV
ncbi:hypothetical protein VTJ49DRAFT_6684 [Mycothermus thermophilus]|uniref:Homeobox domain-containing protein n=1 Tax=Humicola insolens TaxID=85995 RepID=A0ABR3VII4_HUMIN